MNPEYVDEDIPELDSKSLCLVYKAQKGEVWKYCYDNEWFTTHDPLDIDDYKSVEKFYKHQKDTYESRESS